MFPALLAVLLAFAPQDLSLIENVNPKVRLLAIQLAAEQKSPGSILRLIGRLEADDENAENKAAAQSALEKITGKQGVSDPAGWRSWWAAEGRTFFQESSASADGMAAQIKEDVMKDITKARQDVRAITTGLAVAILLFVFVMLFFVGHVSSKIKGWRELVSRAEIYVKHGQELTDRTDKIVAELEAKKKEIAATLETLRKEHEEGIARRGDDLGTELAHEMRMEIQTLRQKAERELDQTVTDLKTQIESTARRVASEARDRLAK